MKQIPAKQWAKHYHQWQKSDKSQRRYCEIMGLNFATFKNNIYKLRQQGEILKGRPKRIIGQPEKQTHSKPILDAWFNWLQEHKDKTLKESPIGKAIRYVLNHWDGLQTYLTDGRTEINNNATERDIKPFVIARSPIHILNGL